MEEERMEPELYDAAKFGNFDCLTNMVGYPQIDLNQTTPTGNNLLHVAVQHGQANFVKHLFDQCPSSGQSLLFQGNHRGDTPLHIAAKVGSLIISEIFIGFAKNIVLDAERGQVDRLKELLRKENVDKDTAMHYAARYDHSSVATLLIELDPELCNIANVAAESPLYVATAQGNLDTAKEILLASPPQSSHKGPRGLTALHAAINYELAPLHLVKIIVERRPEMIRERDDIGWTPLHYAARHNKMEAVRLFLQRDVSAGYLLDNDGESALHIAAFSGHFDVIKELIKSSSYACELVNNKGQTFLHIAAICGRLDVVDFILKAPSFKFLINEQDKDGNTAFHLAALHRQYGAMYALRRNQMVNRGLLNKEHLTALDIFNRRGEGGFRAAWVNYLLKRTSGVQFMQDKAIKWVKKWQENQSFESQLATSTATKNNNVNNQGKIDSSTETALNVSQALAVFIATATFTAAFAVPGGFNSDEHGKGMATLAGKAAFIAFEVSNIVAFFFSVSAVFFQMDSSFNVEVRARYARIVPYSIGVALIGMGLAFVCGTYAILPKTSGVGVFPFVLGGCVVIGYKGIGLMDPTLNPSGRSRQVRNFLFDLLETYLEQSSNYM